MFKNSRPPTRLRNSVWSRRRTQTSFCAFSLLKFVFYLQNFSRIRNICPYLSKKTEIVQKKVKNIWWDTQSVLLLWRNNHTNSSTTMKKYMYPETKFYAVVMQTLMGSSDVFIGAGKDTGDAPNTFDQVLASEIGYLSSPTFFTAEKYSRQRNGSHELFRYLRLWGRCRQALRPVESSFFVQIWGKNIRFGQKTI